MSDINVLYLSIPYEWSNTYYKLLYLLAYNGKNIIDDCNYTCANKGNNVFTCWNLFQSAIAAKELGEDKKATLFKDYVDKQLNYYINNDAIDLPKFDTNDYPKLSLKPNGDNSYTLVISYNDYTKELKIPDDGSVTPDPKPDTPTDTNYVYYGVVNTNNVEDIDIDSLTKNNSDIFDKNIDFTTTESNSIICFVSNIKLSFISAGLPLTCNSKEYNNLYYYWTDELKPSISTITINKG